MRIADAVGVAMNGGWVLKDCIYLCCLVSVLAFVSQAGAERVFSRGYERADSSAEIIERIRQYPSDGGLMLRLKKAIAKETDPLLRQQGLAIISLAMLLRGELDVATRARAALLKHYPDSEYSEALAVENLGAPCPSCNGEGRIAVTCPVCMGSGSCPMCKGAGRLEMTMARSETVCPKCGGSGACTECDGSGRKYRSCHKCNGTGMLLDKRKVERVYKAVLAGEPEEAVESRIHDSDPDRGDLERKDEDVLQYF